MKRNFTRVDRVAQMTMQEELIAKKKLEILEKQRTKEIGKQIAAAQKNVATNSVPVTSEVIEGDCEEKEVISTEETPTQTVHPLIAAANIPKLQNNFCNDGSFFEYYKKIIDQTKQEEEAKKQAEAKFKSDLSGINEEVKPDVEQNSENILEGENEANDQKNNDVKTETEEFGNEVGEKLNQKSEMNFKIEEQDKNQNDRLKAECVENMNVSRQENLLSNMNASVRSVVQSPSYNDQLNQYNLKNENQQFNQNYQLNHNMSTRPNYLQGHYQTQLSSQSNTVPIHMQAFNLPPNATFNINLPPPMINFAIQQATPPPPPPPLPVLVPMPQPAPNLFQNSYPNHSIFLMQHQTPQQISIPFQQQPQQMLQQQPPPPVPMLQSNPLEHINQTQCIAQPSPVAVPNSSELTFPPISLSSSTPIPQAVPQLPSDTHSLTSNIIEDSHDSLPNNDSEEIKDEVKPICNSDEPILPTNRSNSGSPLNEKEIKNIVFSEDSKRVDQTKSMLPTSLQSCIDMVAENGDAFEDFMRSKKDEVHSSLWFLFDMESEEYAIYRQSIMKARDEISNKKRNAIYKSNDEKYDPESVCDDHDDNDSDDEYMKGMLNRNTNNLKRRIETRVEFEEEERLKEEEEERLKKRKSRWGEKIEPSVAPTITAMVQTSFANQNKPMLSGIQRTDPALLQYAKLNYGGLDLSEEDWQKCEEHFKVNLLYQDMMKKRREIDQLAKSGKFKYEYDSDEDTMGGTWEHKLRMAEMEATDAWAHALTKQSEGKHHIGDFLPPEELKKFMEQYEAQKNNRQPDLSDYKEFKLKEDNKGFQMLQKLGWQEGQGLGAGGEGIVDPINKATQREANQGLGANSGSIPNDGDNEYEAYRKRMMLAYRFRPNPLNNPRRAYY